MDSASVHDQRSFSVVDSLVLLFLGKNDPFGPPEIGERILKIMSQAALKIIEGGHTPWLTESEYIAPILSRFLHQIDKLNG